MKKFRYAVALLVVFALVAAFSVLAVGNDNDNGDKKVKKPDQGLGQIKAIEKAVERLEKFEVKFDKDTLAVGLAPASLSINPHGNVRITNGRVTAVSFDRVTVEIWKLAFVVHKMDDTKVFAGKTQELAFSDIKVGDSVDVLGEMDSAAAAFIHARVIHNRAQVTKEREEQLNNLRARINELIARLTEILRKTGQPIPTGLPSPIPTASPSPSPSPSPDSSPSPSPSPSPTP